MVVGGEVVTLKSIEESTGIVMQEMPMQVSLLVNSYVLYYYHTNLRWLSIFAFKIIHFISR
jgi:hypothetical protein